MAEQQTNILKLMGLISLSFIFNTFLFSLLYYQGVLLLKPDVIPDGQEGSQKIMRLWIHEVYRVFYDRLVDENDRDLFFNMVQVGWQTSSQL